MSMTTPLAELTTLRVGGAPYTLLRATTRDELIDAAREAFADERWYILGGGSNTLASDSPFEGTVVQVATHGIGETAEGERVVLEVEAGHDWDALVNYTVARGWAGLEALSGIPGTVGAAPIQNVGAYGQEVASVLSRVLFMDAQTDTIEWLGRDELELGYRSSVLKALPGESEPRRRGVVIAVEFELHDTAGLSESIAYEQLATSLGQDLGARVPLASVRESVLALRASKGMLLDPRDPDTASAGSFFTNPIVTEAFALSLPAEAPRWPLQPDEPALVIPLEQRDAQAEALAAHAVVPRLVKLSAAWLIEHSGIARGFALPGSRAAVSHKHTLALTNRGGANAEDIAQLARYVQGRVQAEFGVLLQPEPTLLDVEL